LVTEKFPTCLLPHIYLPPSVCIFHPPTPSPFPFPIPVPVPVPALDLALALFTCPLVSRHSLYHLERLLIPLCKGASSGTTRSNGTPDEVFGRDGAALATCGRALTVMEP